MCALHASPTSGVVRLSSASRAGARARAAPRACALPPRRGLRRVRVRCASEGADAELAAVQRALSANAAQLDNPSAPQALPQDAALALAQLVEEERRLASLEAELASAEQGITARERELLAKLLARQRLQQLQPSTSELQTRLESTEAEAAVRGPVSSLRCVTNTRGAVSDALTPLSARTPQCAPPAPATAQQRRAGTLAARSAEVCARCAPLPAKPSHCPLPTRRCARWSPPGAQTAARCWSRWWWTRLRCAR